MMIESALSLSLSLSLFNIRKNEGSDEGVIRRFQDEPRDQTVAGREERNKLSAGTINFDS